MDANDEVNAEAIDEPEVAVPADDTRPSFEDNQRRLRRVLDYQDRALAKDDELVSNIASLNSGFLRIALRLEETIELSMGSGPVSLDRMERIRPAIDTHLKVGRQIVQFTQIEVRAADRCKSGSHQKIDVDAAVGNSSEPNAARSEDLNN